MVKVLTLDKPAEVMNKQMELLGATFDQLASIHESVAKIAEMQESHANLLRELSGLLGLNVNDNKDEESRIIKL